MTYFEKRRIYLDKEFSEKEFRETVVHELVHAFLRAYGIDLSSVDDVEETVCDFVGEHIKKISKLTSKIVKAWKAELLVGLLS